MITTLSSIFALCVSASIDELIKISFFFLFNPLGLSHCPKQESGAIFFFRRKNVPFLLKYGGGATLQIVSTCHNIFLFMFYC